MVREMRNDELTLLVIGLDGATFDIIRPVIGAGRLPKLGALMEKMDGSQGSAQ
jgi:predicted AlkP superfamily phosphohydrolase/phosphomutase